MKQLLRDKVWWPGLDRNVEERVKECLGCTVVTKENPPQPMQRTKLPTRAFELVAIDFWTAKEINKVLLVLPDYFTRYVTVSAITTNDALHTIGALEKTFGTFGNPDKIKLDNGPPFQSVIVKEWARSRNIKLVHTIPYWPQQNGQVERQMQGIGKALKIAKLENVHWNTALEKNVETYNQRPHATLGESLADLMFHREVKGLLPIWPHEKFNFDEEMRDAEAKANLKGKIYGDKRRGAKWSELKVRHH